LVNQPLTPEAPLVVAIPPIVDLVVAEQPDRVEQPRVENATIPPPNPPGNDAREQAAPDAPAAEEPEIPRVDPRQHANQRLRREAEEIVYECQEFLELYEGIQLNQLLLSKLVLTSDTLLADISTCCDKLIDVDELTDAGRELKRWQRNIKAFLISKLGSYETPAPAVAAPTQLPTPPSAPYNNSSRKWPILPPRRRTSLERRSELPTSTPRPKTLETQPPTTRQTPHHPRTTHLPPNRWCPST
jgi:hypothetical protein